MIYCPRCGNSSVNIETRSSKIGGNEGTTFIADDDGDSVEYYAGVIRIDCDSDHGCGRSTIVEDDIPTPGDK